MKAAFMVVCLLLAAAPSQAATYLELGNSPVLSIMWEMPSFAFGFGTGFGVNTQHFNDPFLGTVDQTLIYLSPDVTGQFFLNQSPQVRSFLELRVGKGVPIFSGERTEVLEQFADDWNFAAGFGLKSAVADRLKIGGVAAYNLALHTSS